MKLVVSAALVGTIAVAGPSSSEPHFVTLQTKTTFDTRHPATFETRTIQSNGTRQRVTRHIQIPDRTVTGVTTHVLQCDRQRTIVINEENRLFAVEPVVPVSRESVHRGWIDSRPVVETRVIDAVDTGERRAVGPLTAYHVVTTTTSERDGRPPFVVNVRDGWYVDMPWRGCDDTQVAAVLIGGSRNGRVDVKWLGRKTGLPIEEREESTGSGYLSLPRTELLEVSTAPIPADVFDVPRGYRPALPLPGGGHDMNRADGVVNRVTSLWDYATSWLSRWWS